MPNKLNKIPNNQTTVSISSIFGISRTLKKLEMTFIGFKSFSLPPGKSWQQSVFTPSYQGRRRLISNWKAFLQLTFRVQFTAEPRKYSGHSLPTLKWDNLTLKRSLGKRRKVGYGERTTNKIRVGGFFEIIIKSFRVLLAKVAKDSGTASNAKSNHQ